MEFEKSKKEPSFGKAMTKRVIVLCFAMAFVFAMLLMSTSASAATPIVDVSGNIATDTTWVSTNEYHVRGDIVVPAGVTLTIQPGTKILFDISTDIQVAGTLKAVGSSSSKIVMAANSTTPSVSYWDGIWTSGSGYLNMSFVDLSYLEKVDVNTGGKVAFNNIWIDRTTVGLELSSNDNITLSVTNVHITNYTNMGVYVYGGLWQVSVDIASSEFSTVYGGTTYGMYANAANSIKGNLTIGFEDVMIDDGYYGLFAVAGNRCTIDVTSSTITNQQFGAYISANNHTMVNLAGSTFEDNYYGAYAWTLGNLTADVSGCTFSSNNYGFYSTTSDNLEMTIGGESVFDGNEYGVYVDSSDVIDLTISDATFEDNDYGVGVWGDDIVVDVTSSTFTGNNYGLYLYPTYDCELNIAGNDFSENNYGLYVDSSSGHDVSGEISDNTFEYMDNYAIQLYDANGLAISGNTFNYCGMDHYYAVYLNSCNDTTIEDNQLMNNYGGVQLQYVDNTVVQNNMVSLTLSSYGLYVYSAETILIESNTFVNNDGQGAVELYEVWDAVVGNNTFMANWYGVYVYDYDVDDRITFYNNIFSDNEDGIWFEGGYDSPDVLEWYGMKWIIDDAAVVYMTDMRFNGEIIVMDGAELSVEGSYFEIGISSVDGSSSIVVEENATLVIKNSEFDGIWSSMPVEPSPAFLGDAFEMLIYGTVEAQTSCFYDFREIYIAEGSDAEFRECNFEDAYDNMIFVDNSAPVFSSCVFMYGNVAFKIAGADANPKIISSNVYYFQFGVYAVDSNLGGVYDNIFAMIDFGIYAENVTGAIHDNTFMFCGTAITLKGCDVTIYNNEFGWTRYVDAVAQYLPLVQMLMATFDFDIEDLPTAPGPMDMLGDFGILGTGVFAEDSIIEMKGNSYGLLNQCVYVLGGELVFKDKVEMNTLELPYFYEGNVSKLALDVPNMNGIYAANAKVTVEGAYIEVLDDAIVLENCQADIKGSTLVAGDLDIYAMGSSEVNVKDTTYKTTMTEGTSSIDVEEETDYTMIIVGIIIILLIVAILYVVFGMRKKKK